jgi:hypothetical protein
VRAVLLLSLHSAGHGVLDDGEGPPRPPRPAPAQRRLLAAADRPIQYDPADSSIISLCLSRLLLSQIGLLGAAQGGILVDDDQIVPCLGVWNSRG